MIFIYRSHLIRPFWSAAAAAAGRPGKWQGLVIAVRPGPDGDPVVAQQWVDARDIRPIEADPNRAFGLR